MENIRQLENGVNHRTIDDSDKVSIGVVRKLVLDQQRAAFWRGIDLGRRIVDQRIYQSVQ